MTSQWFSNTVVVDDSTVSDLFDDIKVKLYIMLISY